MRRATAKISILLIAALFVWFQMPPPIWPQPAKSTDEFSQLDPLAAFDPAALIANERLPADPNAARITLELKGVDVLDVLKILSTRSGLNIVAGKNVRGQVSIYLKDVQIREALNVIISALGLAYEEDQGIIKVMTDKEYEQLHGRAFRDTRLTKTFKMKHADSKAVQQVIQQLKGPAGKVILDERTNTLIVADVPEIVREIEDAITELDAPLVTQVMRLNYATAEDLEEKLKDYVTPETGILKVDKRSNQVSITDRKEKVERIVEVVKALDIRPPQVLIEAQILEVSLFDAFRYGIDWEFVRNKLTNQLTDVNFQPAFSIAAPGSDVGSGSLSTFTLGNQRFAKGVRNSVISILQNVGKTNILSAPRLTVLNNEEAKLTDATKQPYVTSTVVPASGTSATNLLADSPAFVDVGVSLTVVPTISDEDTVILKLKPEVSVNNGDFNVPTIGAQAVNSFNRTIPIIATQSLETTVIVKSGETLIVGGLIKDKESKIIRKLPLVGDLPFFGSLFRSETIDFRKTELVIFLTPYLISGDVGSAEHEGYFDSDGQMHELDKVGGFDFALAQRHSQGAMRQDNKPYWRVKRLAFPRYWQPRNLYKRAEPYQDKRNTFESAVEGRVLLDKQLLLQAYEESLGREAIAALESLEPLQGLNGRMDIGLLVRRDGVLEDVTFTNPGRLKDNYKLRRVVLQKIRGASPFLPFPKGLDSEKELFDLKFEFQKAEP